METFNEILQSSELTLVDFFATWCGPCKMMHTVLEQLKDEMKNDIRIVKIDVDKNFELAGAYNVQSVPTLIFFRNGKVVWRQSGAMPLSSLREVVSQLNGD